jgi:hypothetical protein
MPTRVLIAYVLIALLVAAAGVLAWRANYYSERNVRRRAREARRQRRRMESQAQDSAGGNDPAL